MNTQPLPPYVKKVIDEAAKVQPVLLSKARYQNSPFSPIFISVVKDELPLLKELMAHYRSLGVERMVIIDNGSTDGSLDYLSAQPDVDLFSIQRRFLWPYKQGWISKIISLYGYDRWYLYADADEHLVFDQLGTRTILDLADHSDRLGIRRVRGMLVDMYASDELLGSNAHREKTFKEMLPLFDSDSYIERRFTECISRKGGPRRRAFSQSGKGFNPELSKYPLFRPRKADLMANPHHIYPYAENFSSPCWLGILHYKFLPGFIDKIHRAIREQNYWDGSAEYKRYLQTLTDNPNLSLTYDGSRVYRSPNDLIASKVIEPVDWSA